MFQRLFQHSPHERLTRIQADYQTIANCDPHQLRLAIPKEELWRFFVDGLDQKSDKDITIKRGDRFSLQSRLNLNDDEMEEVSTSDITRLNTGWLLYEKREPGYLHGLYSAFQLIFTDTKPLDLAFIMKLHHQATASVKKTNYDYQYCKSSPGEMRKSKTCGYGLTHKLNATRAGLKELFAEFEPYMSVMLNDGLKITIETFAVLKSGQPIDYAIKFRRIFPREFQAIMGANSIYDLGEVIYEMVEHSNMVVHYYSELNNDPVLELKQSAQRYIDLFNESMSTQKTPMEKLHCIIKLIQRLERLHMFQDANCRTFCMLLLPHLLIKHGLPLCILPNPNQFDAYSHQELVEATLTGMENTFELIRTKKLFNVKTEDVLSLLDKPNSLSIKRDSFEQVTAIEDRARRRLDMTLACKKRKKERP
jgi:hypothetical protein